jgi:hypothetical protein
MIRRKKKSKSLDDLLEDPSYLLHHHEFIGKGIYGHVKELHNSNGDSSGIVAKISGCVSHLIGDPDSTPFRSERIEPRILNFLWKYIVETHISPHLICPIGSHSIVNGCVPEQVEEDSEMKQSAIFFMEKCNGGTLRHHLLNTEPSQFDHVFKVLLFQVCYTLGCIMLKWENFRHNDLKDDNIFISKTSSAASYQILGNTYTLPEINAVCMIGDFDFSCISGYMFDNYKVLEQDWNTPSLNINSNSDQRADLYSLITYIRCSFKDKMSARLQGELDSIFGKYSFKNNHRLSPTETAPTVFSLFNETSFFDLFKNNKHRGLPDYDADNIVTLKITYEINWQNSGIVDYRHVPIILPRNKPSGTLLPSLLYFRKCPPVTISVDESMGVAYDARIFNKILDLLGFIYSCVSKEKFKTKMISCSSSAKKDLIEDFTLFFKFPPNQKNTFLKTIEAKARSFVTKYIIPLKWWYYMFTCFFVDEAVSMGLVKDLQECWTHNRWG